MITSADLLVVAEAENGRASALALEMLGLAGALASDSGRAIHACVLGSDLDGAARDLAAHGADRVHVVDAPGLDRYQADAWLPDLLDVIGAIGPGTVIVGHTASGADLAPRLAFRLRTTLATACTGAAVDGGRLRVARSCYGGKAEEVVSFRTSPAVLTVKPRCFAPTRATSGRAGEIVRRRSVLDPATVRTRIRDHRRSDDGGSRLESARVVVAGGGGMKGPEGFALAERLATLLGGAVGASRVACDLGWCPPSRQIGLSGKTVAPELYVAVGISGAGQHMAGCSKAGTIVAINTDPDAPIFRYARFGVIGDGHVVLPALIDRLAARSK